jgi:hypothetical protein
MMLTLHEKLESEGPRLAPEPGTAEELVARRSRPSTLVGLVLFAAAAGATLVALDEFGLVELPKELVLGGLLVLTAFEVIAWLIGSRDEEVGDDD